MSQVQEIKKEPIEEGFSLKKESTQDIPTPSSKQTPAVTPSKGYPLATTIIHFDDLPSALVFRIFRLLPWQDHYRLRVVCKSWNNRLKYMVLSYSNQTGEADLSLPSSKCDCTICTGAVEFAKGKVYNWSTILLVVFDVMRAHLDRDSFTEDELFTFLEDHWEPIGKALDKPEKNWEGTVRMVLASKTPVLLTADKPDLFERDGEWWALQSPASDSEGETANAKGDDVESILMTLAFAKDVPPASGPSVPTATPSVEVPVKMGPRKAPKRPVVPSSPPPSYESLAMVHQCLANNETFPFHRLALPPPTTHRTHRSDPVEVRTGRFVTVRLTKFDRYGRRAFVSWTPNNGLPANCLVIVPIVGSNISLSFKSKGRGWLELDTSNACAPSYHVSFDVRIDPAVDLETNTVQKKGDFAALQFVVIDKRGAELTRLGSAFIDVILRSTKNEGKLLQGPIVYDLYEAHRSKLKTEDSPPASSPSPPAKVSTQGPTAPTSTPKGPTGVSPSPPKRESYPLYSSYPFYPQGTTFPYTGTPGSMNGSHMSGNYPSGTQGIINGQGLRYPTYPQTFSQTPFAGMTGAHATIGYPVASMGSHMSQGPVTSSVAVPEGLKRKSENSGQENSKESLPPKVPRVTPYPSLPSGPARSFPIPKLPDSSQGPTAQPSQSSQLSQPSQETAQKLTQE